MNLKGYFNLNKFKIPSCNYKIISNIVHTKHNKPDIDFAQKLDLTTQKLDEIFPLELTKITTPQDIVDKLNQLLKSH